MRKMEVWSWFFVTLCILAVLSGGTLLFINAEWSSERAKRIELEKQFAEWRQDDWKKFAISLYIDTEDGTVWFRSYADTSLKGFVLNLLPDTGQ